MHQGRMRTYGIDRIRYKGNSNHYVGNLTEDARLRDSHFLIPAKHVYKMIKYYFPVADEPNEWGYSPYIP